MKSSRRRRNKKIDELCSAGSSITMLVTLYLVFKYHDYWQVVVICIFVVLLCLLVAVVAVTSIIKTIRISRAMVTDDYDYMSGEDFEYFCADILRGNGFKDVEVTKASGDHGIDVLAKKDGVKYAIQCKRYSKPVGNKAVQEAYSGKAIYNADVAVVMSNMDFTPQAIEDARKLKVELWDRNNIYSLQRNGNVGVEQYITQPIEENYSTQNTVVENIKSDQTDTLICPNCGGKLVLRTAKRGANIGSQFYGCSNYPNCKYTRNI